jgi:hypothetical protein
VPGGLTGATALSERTSEGEFDDERYLSRSEATCDRRCAVSTSSTPLHPVATHHLPAFITAPGETDVLMVVMTVFLIVVVVAFGILFLRLHSLPERMAHRSHKIQFEIVAVLCLIALFTHIHAFWVAALLLAMIDLPDFGGSLARIAGSAEKIAGLKPGEGEGPDYATVTGKTHEGAAEPPHDAVVPIKRSDGARDAAPRPDLAPASTRS